MPAMCVCVYVFCMCPGYNPMTLASDPRLHPPSWSAMQPCVCVHGCVSIDMCVLAKDPTTLVGARLSHIACEHSSGIFTKFGLFQVI